MTQIGTALTENEGKEKIMAEYLRNLFYEQLQKESDGELVEVVRCKDCKHFFRDDMGNVVVYRCELNHEDMRDDFYCADGERREDER